MIKGLIIYLIIAFFILALYIAYVLFKESRYVVTIEKIEDKKKSPPLNIRPKFLRELIKHKSKADYPCLKDLIYEFFSLDVFPHDYFFNKKEDDDFYTLSNKREMGIRCLARNYTFFLNNADEEEVNSVCNETLSMIIRLRKEIDLKPELPFLDKEKYNKRISKLCRILEEEINENYENIVSRVYKVDNELLKEADELITDRM